MRNSFNDYWAPEAPSTSTPSIEKSPLKLKKLILDNEELNTFDATTKSSWAASSSVDPNLVSGQTLDSNTFDPSTSTVVDDKTFSRVATSQVAGGDTSQVAGGGTTFRNKGKIKVDSVYPGNFPGRFPPKTE